MEPVWIYISAFMGNAKPTAEIVCVCENVITDARGTASLISIIERIDAAIPADLPPDAVAGFPVKSFLRLRAAKPLQKGTVRLLVHKPLGGVGVDAKMPVAFKDHPRANFQATFELVIAKPENGSYRFEFLWDEEPLTSVSIEVKLMPTLQPESIQPVAGN
jgi:hypothetical protein